MSIDFNAIYKEVLPTAENILSSYAQKGTVDNGTWLTGVLSANKDTASDAQRLSRTIQSSVGRFSQNMQSINDACTEGKTKEKWLKEFIQNNSDLNQDEKCHYLAQVEAALKRGNEVMVNFVIAPAPVDLSQEELPSDEQTAQWSRYTTINNIAQQSVLMGSNGVQILIDQNALQGEEILQDDISEESLNPKIDEGLKMATAAALKIGQVAGKIPCLPKDTPLSVIIDIACVGVEMVKNIGRVATGKISPMQAMENIGRASIIAVADFFATGIPAMALHAVPFVGPVLSSVCAGFLTSRSSTEIQEKIYAGINKIKPYAIKATNTFHSTMVNTKNKVRNSVNAVFNSL